MKNVKKVVLNAFIWSVFIGASASVFADNSEDCPPIDPRFKEIYEELRQEEYDIFKQINARQPNFSKDDLQSKQKEHFNVIKKDYSGTPACTELSGDTNVVALSKEQFGDFLKQYTECVVEQNGMDPKKLDIQYDYDDSDLKKPTSLIRDNGFIINKNRFYDIIQNNQDSNSSENLYLVIHGHVARIRFYEGMIPYLNAMRSSASDNKKTKQLFDKLKDLILDNSAIIAAMQDEKTLNSLLYTASRIDDDQKKKDRRFNRMLRYLLKIKNIIQKWN